MPWKLQMFLLAWKTLCFLSQSNREDGGWSISWTRTGYLFSSMTAETTIPKKCTAQDSHDLTELSALCPQHGWLSREAGAVGVRGGGQSRRPPPSHLEIATRKAVSLSGGLSFYHYPRQKNASWGGSAARVSAVITYRPRGPTAGSGRRFIVGMDGKQRTVVQTLRSHIMGNAFPISHW